MCCSLLSSPAWSTPFGEGANPQAPVPDLPDCTALGYSDMAYILREAARLAGGLVIALGWIAVTCALSITAQLLTVDEEWKGWDFGLGLIFFLPWLALSGVAAAALWALFRRQPPR